MLLSQVVGCFDWSDGWRSCATQELIYVTADIVLWRMSWERRGDGGFCRVVSK